jgi:hypothetical protein
MLLFSAFNFVEIAHFSEIYFKTELLKTRTGYQFSIVALFRRYAMELGHLMSIIFTFVVESENRQMDIHEAQVT